MSVRVTDEEVASFSTLERSGRRWVVRLPEGATITASGAEPGLIEGRLVPDELVLTGREALAFAMGVAVGGSRSETRRQTARRKWGWE